jgi:membrane protein
MRKHRTLLEAIYRLYEHSGFSMAGSVAFSFIVSLFPFCIFLGALAGLFGGRALAEQAIAQLFLMLPKPVAEGLAPQVTQIMGGSRIDLLTLGGAIALFFATSAIETMRSALNGAYRVHETRPYPLCLAISMLFVLINAISSLVITWLIVVGPAVAAEFEPDWLRTMHDARWWSFTSRYGVSAAVMILELIAFHLWLAAGRRTMREVLPGVLLSVVLWLAVAGLYSYYLSFSDYKRFYAGLSQLMIALLFFQWSAVIIILGAELNLGLIEIRRLTKNGVPGFA